MKCYMHAYQFSALVVADAPYTTIKMFTQSNWIQSKPKINQSELVAVAVIVIVIVIIIVIIIGIVIVIVIVIAIAMTIAIAIAIAIAIVIVIVIAVVDCTIVVVIEHIMKEDRFPLSRFGTANRIIIATGTTRGRKR